jgi:hypothetical protein
LTKFFTLGFDFENPDDIARSMPSQSACLKPSTPNVMTSETAGDAANDDASNAFASASPLLVVWIQMVKKCKFSTQLCILNRR